MLVAGHMIQSTYIARLATWWRISAACICGSHFGRELLSDMSAQSHDEGGAWRGNGKHATTYTHDVEIGGIEFSCRQCAEEASTRLTLNNFLKSRSREEKQERNSRGKPYAQGKADHDNMKLAHSPTGATPAACLYPCFSLAPAMIASCGGHRVCCDG